MIGSLIFRQSCVCREIFSPEEKTVPKMSKNIIEAGEKLCLNI